MGEESNSTDIAELNSVSISSAVSPCVARFDSASRSVSFAVSRGNDFSALLNIMGEPFVSPRMNGGGCCYFIAIRVLAVGSSSLLVFALFSFFARINIHRNHGPDFHCSAPRFGAIDHGPDTKR